MTATQIVLLRAVNVGGTGKVAMAAEPCVPFVLSRSPPSHNGDCEETNRGEKIDPSQLRPVSEAVR